MELSCPLVTTGTCLVSQEKFPRKPYNKSFIDQACSVKMAGYWPHSFFACIWTSTLSWSINTQKKKSANTQPSWPHTWSITHIYCPSKVNTQMDSTCLWIFFCLCLGTIGLIVATWKFYVRKTSIFALKASLLGQIFVLRASNFCLELSADSSLTEILYCLNRNLELIINLVV